MDPGPYRRWAHERGDRARRGGARVGVQPPIRDHHRQCRRRQLRAEWTPAAVVRRQRHRHLGARPASRRSPLPVTPSGRTLRRMGLFSGFKERLKDGLKRSQEYLSNGLSSVLEPERPIDDALYEELEEVLIAADLGATLAADFTNRAREEVVFGTVTRADQFRPLFRRFLIETLTPAAQPLHLDARPAVILMLGVNGAGKTTTCAKLAAFLKDDGKQVVLAAADTFRAAAIEQLEVWSGRVGVELVRQASGSDPAAVVFDAVKAALARSADRSEEHTSELQSQSNLVC